MPRTIKSRIAQLEGQRQRLLDKDHEIVEEMRRVRKLCPHPNLHWAPSGRFCEDCGAMEDNHKFDE